MKKVLNILFILTILSFTIFQLQQYVSAITFGSNEPSAEYINMLKTCSVGTVRDKHHANVTEYSIKGVLPNGRCDVLITSYADLSNPEDYMAAKEIFGGFVEMAESMANQSGKKIDRSQIPQADEILKAAQEKKDVTRCKFSKSEREALVNAWSKHDGKNLPPQKTAGGYSFSWDSSKISSYEALMFKFAQGPCDDENSNSKTEKWKKYACEYADTTCYLSISPNNATMMTCTNEAPTGFDSIKLLRTVKTHAQSGMCSQL